MTDQELPDDDEGDPVKVVFPPEKSAARFVVTMSLMQTYVDSTGGEYETSDTAWSSSATSTSTLPAASLSGASGVEPSSS